MPNVTVQGLQYHYREAGRGPLVILGHSDASSSGQWRALMQDLEDEFLLRAFDTAGQGQSLPWPEDRPYSVEAESRIVDALIQSHPGPIHLLGHSAGGMFVLGAALRLGQRVASLILIEPTVFCLLRQTGRQQAWDEIKAVAEAFQQQVHAGDAAQAMAGFVDYWTTTGAWATMPPQRRAPMIATAAKICLQWDASFRDEITLESLSRLTCPTLLMRGTQTTQAAHGVVEILNETWPHARRVEIEGAGHMSAVTHATVVNSHIADHLRRHAAH